MPLLENQELVKPWSGVAQSTTLHKKSAYLQQWCALSTSPLSAELHAILGPVTYIISEISVGTDMGLWTHPPLESHIKEDQAPIPVTAWHTDGSAKSNPPLLTAVAILLRTDNIWQDGRSKQSSPLAELGVPWVALMYESSISLWWLTVGLSIKASLGG